MKTSGLLQKAILSASADLERPVEEEKGIATVKLRDESFRLAEVHWYEAHGIGKRDHKIKFPFLD